MKRCALGLLLVVIFACAGCGSAHYHAASEKKSDSASPRGPSSAGLTDKLAVVDSSESLDGDEMEILEEDADDADNPTAHNRKIIYTAEAHLVVKDLSAADKAVRKLAKENGGFISNSSSDSRYGDQRTGHWVLRIPSANFEDAWQQVGDIGVPEQKNVDSEDVTEEFVDAEARLKTQRTLEAEMLDLLQRTDGELKHVIELERELARVREVIERIEGRLRYLSDRVDLTTITIHAREERDYVPPQAPTFASRISSSWGGSIEEMVQFGQNLVVAFVAAAPWLVALAVLFSPFVLMFRRWRRRRRQRLAAST